MVKIVLPISKANTFPQKMIRANIENVEYSYYANNLQLKTKLAIEGSMLMNEEIDYLVIIENTSVEPFNYFVKKLKIVTAVIENEIAAKYAKRHNNAKILIFNTFALSDLGITTCIKLFLEEVFEAGRHLERIKMMDEVEIWS